jgi:hypothetical protein
MKHAIKTYVYRHSNVCNIQVYFCNIQMKHMKHSKHMLEIYGVEP